MKRDKLETAKKLAKAHFEIEPDIKHIHLILPFDDTEDTDNPIKLLEVVEGTIEVGIEPLWFTAAPARGIDYPTIIVEISPAEYEALRRKGKLDYRDWSIGEELFAS